MKIKRLGIFCLPGRGHLYPASALGRSLKDRGYQVTVFNRNIARAIVNNFGLLFTPIEDRLERSVYLVKSQPPECNGPNTLDIIYDHSLLVLRHARDILSKVHIDALLVDQADLATGTVAESLHIPFVTVSFFPPVYLDDEVPPFIYGWRPGTAISRVAEHPQEQRRNKRANILLGQLLAPSLRLVNYYRKLWNLPKINDLNDLFSGRAIVTQMPQLFDFPRNCQPPHLFYTGLFCHGSHGMVPSFPWHRLNGRPLIYASLGTVRNCARHVFETIALACATFPVQLVMSLGGMALVPEVFGTLPGDPIVVHYAPQLKLLERAKITISHGGMNTVLESIANNVPLIAIPITDDQPGVAARIEWKGVGIALPIRRLTVERLRACIHTLLTDTKYQSAVSELGTDFRKISGLDRAADIIEHVLGLRD
jgi:zeaxanthin glucosyltransferase